MELKTPGTDSATTRLTVRTNRATAQAMLRIMRSPWELGYNRDRTFSVSLGQRDPCADGCCCDEARPMRIVDRVSPGDAGTCVRCRYRVGLDLVVLPCPARRAAERCHQSSCELELGKKRNAS